MTATSIAVTLWSVADHGDSEGDEMNEGVHDLFDLIRETERLCLRYVNEVVLPFQLCPWAAPSLQAGRVQIHVITDIFSPASGYLGAADQVRRALGQQIRPEVELALIVLPRALLSRLEMDDLLRAVRESRRFGDGAAQEEAGRESVPAFALAAFHPGAAPDSSTPERLIPFLRRSPDPMLQAVRSEVLAKIQPGRGAGTAFFDPKTQNLASLARPEPLSLRAQIAAANFERLQGDGLKRLEEVYQSILLDHAETRRRLNL